MPVYVKAISRIGFLAILIAGVTVMVKPLRAATQCETACNQAEVQCLHNCHNVPPNPGCGEECGSTYSMCLCGCGDTDFC